MAGKVKKSQTAKSVAASARQTKIAFFLRTWVLVSGVYQTFFGETVAGILTLICLALIVFPSFLSRGRIKKLPIEIESILFIMVVVQFIIGEAHNFYNNVPYYDKFVHYLLPFFVGLIAFLLAYTLYALGKLQISALATVVVIVLIAAGVGAVWEIIEYSSDKILYPRIEGWHHFQGNEQQSAIDDTMSDIIIDTIGGLFGALLGVRYIARRTKSHDPRLEGLVTEIAPLFQEEKKTKKGSKKRKDG